MVLSAQVKNLLLLLPAVLVVACVAVSQSALFLDNRAELSGAITFDLLISVPLIYFLIIRKRSIPKTTVVPVFILGIVVASVILPPEHQQFLNLVKTWFLPFLELTIVVYLIITVRKAIKKFKSDQDPSADFFTATKVAASHILPKGLSTAFATEFSMFYYAFISWKKRKLQVNEFSYHQSTSTRMLLGVFVFLIIVEAFAVHLLLQSYSNVAAWILTILSIYACFQVFGILKSISKRPIAIDGDTLLLRYSVMNEVEIPIDQLKEIKFDTTALEKADGLAFLSPFKDMEGTNIIIDVKEPHELDGFYGFKKSFQRIALYLDEPDEFVENVIEQMVVSAKSQNSNNK